LARRAATTTSSNRLGILARQSSTVIRAIAVLSVTGIHVKCVSILIAKREGERNRFSRP
jgi:hypothetical protein